MILVLTAGCPSSDDGGQDTDTDGASDGSGDTGQTTATNATNASNASTMSGPGDSTGGGESTGGSSMDGTSDTGAVDETGSTGADDESTGAASSCDFQTVDGILVMEAESLPIGEDWMIGTEVKGFYGPGYIDWMGEDHPEDVSNGVVEVTIGIAEAGRYRLQWRNQVGSTTDNNDSWVKFADATGFYGVQPDGDNERRVYPVPECQDKMAMAEVEALPEVSSVSCVEGQSLDGWLKVYSVGADEWTWSTRTNDFDGFDVVAEFDAPGDYTFSFAARSSRHLIDRLVIHRYDLENDVVRDESLAETPCR